jgi:hypothetical protein
LFCASFLILSSNFLSLLFPSSFIPSHSLFLLLFPFCCLLFFLLLLLIFVRPFLNFWFSSTSHPSLFPSFVFSSFLLFSLLDSTKLGSFSPVCCVTSLSFRTGLLVLDVSCTAPQAFSKAEPLFC